MAKPILIVRCPTINDPKTGDSYEAELRKAMPDYNVALIWGRLADTVTFEIITEHNQPQGLSV
jgi:hypothetical protein